MASGMISYVPSYGMASHPAMAYWCPAGYAQNWVRRIPQHSSESVMVNKRSEPPPQENFTLRMTRHVVDKMARQYVNLLAIGEFPDTQMLFPMFEYLYTRDAYPHFRSAVQTECRRLGRQPEEPLDMLRRVWNKRHINRIFRANELKALEDTLHLGRDTFRGTPGEYRRYGIWHAVSQFVGTLCKHPIVSAGIITAVAVSGYLWPFWGGLSGAVILGCATTSLVYSELRALTMPHMNEKKAHLYINSGENLTDFVLTMSGIDGIGLSLLAGVKAFQETGRVMKTAGRVSRVLNQVKAAFLSNPTSVVVNGVTQTSKRGAFQTFRFIIGLFDNVLMPFNSTTEYLKHRASNRPRDTFAGSRVWM